MAKRWFDLEVNKYPPMIVAIMEAIRVYYWELLYSSLPYVYTSVKTDPIEKAKEEAANSGRSRFILTDITNRALQDNSKIFQLSNATIPFTAFNYGDIELDNTRFNKEAHIGVYADSLKCKIDAKPMKLFLNMVSFFATGFDYFRALTILNEDNASKTIITVPLVINGYTTSIPILLSFESIVKGTYAWEFAEQLNVGKIQDIVHNTEVHYYDLITDASIAPVDNIDLYLNSYSGNDYRDSKQETYTIMPETPIVSSTTPAHASVGVLVESQILINFNQAMNESSAEGAIYFDPFISMDYVWNSSGTSVIIQPSENLTSGTIYSGAVYTTAQSSYGIPFGEDYGFFFTTEG